MRPLLDNYIRSLGTGNQTKIGLLLREATVSKENMETIVNTLSSLQPFASPTISNIEIFSSTDADVLRMNFRDVQTHFAEMFRISNLLSIFLQSQSSILSSEIKSLSDEITTLEKLVENYSFLLSENAAYNYAYLEPFSDDNNRDVFDYALTDRGGGFFNELERAHVNTSNGTLVLSPSLIEPYPLVGQIVKSNISGNITTQTLLRNAFNKDESEGWLVTIKSPSPVVTALAEANGVTGAQVILEAALPQASPCNQIDLTPIVDHEIDVLQIKLFTSDDDFVGRDVLPSPIPVNNLISVTFPIQPVKKFHILINQKKYTRPSMQPTAGEFFHISAWKKIRDHEHIETHKNYNSLRNNRGHRYLSIYKYVVANNRAQMSWSLPTNESPQMMNRFHQMIEARKNQLAGLTNDLLASGMTQPLPPIFSTAATQMLNSSLRGLTTKVLPNSNRRIDSVGDQTLANLPILNFPPQKVNSTATFYHYSFGFKNIAIGLGAMQKKGVHISKTLSSNGDMGQVRIKTSEKHFRADRSDLDSTRVSSVEYSISNVASPREESDWIPILPVDQNFVEGERLLPNSVGVALLRFAASMDESIVLYKNNKKVNTPSADMLVMSPNKQTIMGLKIPYASYDKNDIFTVDYFPAEDPSLVRFSDNNFDLPPLVAAYDNTGIGEWFEGTTGRNSVTLSHYPYVDYDQVASSYYSPLFGISPYQPITVTIDNKIAINLTNYTKVFSDNNTGTGVAPSFDQVQLNESGYYFYHAQNLLIFNQPITVPFRVSYQYIENTVRVRTVLRVNDPSCVSPQIDYWQLKAKTRRPDIGAEV